MLQARGTGTQLQIEQQIRKNRIVENNMTSHELGYELWIQIFIFGPNFFFLIFNKGLTYRWQSKTH